MKRVISLFILSVAVYWANASVPVVVVDKSDDSPVIGATVIDKYGIILGVTDDTGRISVKSGQNFPITIRCIGYEPVTTTANDTVRLNVSSYQLSEVVVTPADRPIKRVLCFAREYSSGIAGSDTMQYYCEYMAEAFIAEGKVKGYKRYHAKPYPKAYKRYGRIVMGGKDSIFQPQRYDDITELSWYYLMAYIPTEKIELPEAIKNGEESDTIYGKYGPWVIRKKKNNLYTETSDVLSNQKNRKWSPFLLKLIGMTVDLDRGIWTQTFADKGNDSFDIHDLISSECTIHLIGRGRWIKKILKSKHPIEMNSYLEMYPVEITNCTVQEYKEMEKDNSRLPFQYPEGLQPLSPAVQELVERVDAISSDGN